MKPLLISVIILLFSDEVFLKQLAIRKCPKPEDLFPCSCHIPSYNIECSGSSPFDIKKVFDKVSQDPEVVATIFDSLLIFTNKNVKELPEGAFGKLKFKSIQIRFDSKALNKIHYKAFEASFDTTRSLTIEPHGIQSEKLPSDYSLLKLLNSFKNLQYFRVDSNVGALENKTFEGNILSVNSIQIRVDNLVGSPFSKFNNLSVLHLIFNNTSDNLLTNESLSIGHRFDKEGKVLEIYLENGSFKGLSFGEGAFSSKNLNVRPLDIIIRDGNITFLKEDVFKPILSDEKNKLNFPNSQFDCNDCRSSWICKLPAKRRNSFLGRCKKDQKGKKLVDCDDNFNGCSNI